MTSIQKIVILHASQSGTSEYLAGLLHEKLSSVVDYPVIFDSISNFENYIDLDGKTLFLFVISTSMEGSPPDAMVDFYDWMTTSKARSLFTNINFEYSVFGNGNSNYAETYQNASRTLKQTIGTCKIPLIDCREGDQMDGTSEQTFEEWQSDIVEKLTSL